MRGVVELAPGHKQGLLLANPVMPAASTFGYGSEYDGLVETESLGAIVTTPTSLRPQRGRPLPRFREMAGGLLFGTGAQNPGIDRVLRDHSARWARMGVPVILNIIGADVREFASLARRVNAATGIWGLEITLLERADSSAARDIMSAVRAQTLLPIWAKLPLQGAETLAEPCLEGGANALTVASQPAGLHFDLRTRQRLAGQLYGPFVKPMTLRAVDAVLRRINAPVIACGGIHTVEDALEFLALGASAVQVGSATWIEPQTLGRVIAGVKAYLEAADQVR